MPRPSAARWARALRRFAVATVRLSVPIFLFSALVLPARSSRADLSVHLDLASFVDAAGATTLESFEGLPVNNDDFALLGVEFDDFRLEMSSGDTGGIYNQPNQGTFATDGTQYFRTAVGPYGIRLVFEDTLVAFAFDVTDFGDTGTGNLLVEVDTATGTRVFVVAGAPQPDSNRMFFGLTTTAMAFSEVRISTTFDSLGLDALRYRGDDVGPRTITFDTLAHSETLDTQFLGEGLVFEHAQSLHSELFGVAPHSSPAVLNSSLAFRFVVPGAPESQATTDFVSLIALDVDALPNSVTAFDRSGLELAMVPVMGPPFGTREVTLEVPGIHRVVLDGSGGVGIADIFWDNLTFNQVSLVPEPGLFGTAFGAAFAVGFLAGRRRRSGAFRRLRNQVWSR